MSRGATYTDEFREGVIERLRNGERSTDIATSLSIPVGTVAAWASNAGLTKKGESPSRLRNGAWIYDRHGVAHWTPSPMHGGAA